MDQGREYHDKTTIRILRKESYQSMLPVVYSFVSS